MASFPTTNVTYANRSAGQAIASAYINSLQDEIAAIELGYLTGTARLNSSASTVTSLSVTGGSTLNGVTLSTHATPASTTVSLGDSTTAFKEVHCSSLYLAGSVLSNSNSTFANPGVFSAIVTAAQQPILVARTSNTLAVSGESSAVSFLIDDTNIGGMHSTSASPQNITVPHTGLYLVVASSWFPTPANNAERVIRVKQNSTTVARGSVFKQAIGVPNGTVNLSALLPLTASDVLTVTVDGGGNSATFGSASSPQTQTKIAVAKMW